MMRQLSPLPVTRKSSGPTMAFRPDTSPATDSPRLQPMIFVYLSLPEASERRSMTSIPRSDPLVHYLS